MSYFRLPKDTSVHKDWIHATGRPVDNLPSKILICLDHFSKRSALIPAGNFKMNCTITTVKSVEGFSRDQYQLYYLIKQIIKFVYLQRREHWHKERKR